MKTRRLQELILFGRKCHLTDNATSSSYRPQTKFAKVMFLQVSVCPHRGGGGMCGFIGGVCVVLFGGHAWFYPGGVRGFIRGACMVLFRGGHVWFYLGGVHGFIQGVCMVLFGGACMVAPGGHVWLLWGACVVAPGGGVRGFFDEIRSMSGRYASYWNAFLFGFCIGYVQLTTFGAAGGDFRCIVCSSSHSTPASLLLVVSSLMYEKNPLLDIIITCIWAIKVWGFVVPRNIVFYRPEQ